VIARPDPHAEPAVFLGPLTERIVVSAAFVSPAVTSLN
jgi:hypothetical protein